MGVKGRRPAEADADEASSEGGTPSEERKGSGKMAEQSGRGGVVHFFDTETAFSELQEGESWDRRTFSLPAKKRNLMIEIPAGSNIFYQCWAEKMSQTEVFIRIPKEIPEESEYEWLRLTSSRIWRGSMASKGWICVSPSSGSWKPKTLPGREKKVVSRKRSRPPTTDPEQDEPTGATLVTENTSDVEDDAQDSLSPRPVKGSNAVSPDGEDAAVHPKRKDARLDRKGAQVGLGAEGGKGSRASAGSSLEDWFSGHWQLMRRKGLLNHAASAGPESGRVPSQATTQRAASLGTEPSNRPSQASPSGQQPSCSSSSSADKEEGSQQAGRHGSTAAPKASTRPVASRRPVKSEGTLAVDHPASSRSTSPATPHKNGDGYRSAAHRQRSSSMDAEPRANAEVGPKGENACKQQAAGKTSKIVAAISTKVKSDAEADAKPLPKLPRKAAEQPAVSLMETDPFEAA